MSYCYCVVADRKHWYRKDSLVKCVRSIRRHGRTGTVIVIGEQSSRDLLGDNDLLDGNTRFMASVKGAGGRIHTAELAGSYGLAGGSCGRLPGVRRLCDVHGRGGFGDPDRPGRIQVRQRHRARVPVTGKTRNGMPCTGVHITRHCHGPGVWFTGRFHASSGISF